MHTFKYNEVVVVYSEVRHEKVALCEENKNMNNLRDPDTGRFVKRAEELEEQANVLTAEAQALREEASKLVEAEKNPPSWLKNLVIAIADSLGITAEEFQQRVQIVHPTPADPVIMVDGKPVVAWV